MATKINNHMQRDLILRRPQPRSAGGLIVPASAAHEAMTRVVGPGRSGLCDFWDEIKGHPVYQQLLDLRKITLGDDNSLEPGGTEPFTTFGDTLQPPDSLNPEIDAENAENDPARVKLAYGDNEPAISSKRKGGARRAAPANVRDESERAAGAS